MVGPKLFVLTEFDCRLAWKSEREKYKGKALFKNKTPYYYYYWCCLHNNMNFFSFFTTLQQQQLSKRSWRGYFWKGKKYCYHCAALCAAGEKWCFGWMKWKQKNRKISGSAKFWFIKLLFFPTTNGGKVADSKAPLKCVFLLYVRQS